MILRPRLLTVTAAAAAVVTLACLTAPARASPPADDLDALIHNVFGTDPAKEASTGRPPDRPQPQPQPGGGGGGGGQEPAGVDPYGGGKDTRGTEDEFPGDCTCVPYYLCPNGTVLTDGSGLLDIRTKAPGCDVYMDVCCAVPPLDPDHPIKPQPTPRRGCGQRHPDGVGFRITGDSNNEAQFGEFPWMVALLRRTILEGQDLNVYQCGGALIHERVVLTAAHCVVQNDPTEESEMIARLGEWDTQRTTEIFPHQNVKVAKVIVHPGFKRSNLWNDFALLILEQPAALGENVDTVCLPTAGVVPLARECYATGWGKDKFGEKGTYQVILKKIDLPIVTKDQCISLLRKTRLGPFYKLHDSFVCAGGIPGKDTCKGDGGSPMVCPIEGKPGTYEVTGLVAWGIGCGDETPGVYAGVAYARPWIDQELANLNIRLE